MIQETKPTTFEFDPLPGNSPPANKPAEAAAPTEPKKRGRKPKPEKKERKKRGPRRVQAASPMPVSMTSRPATLPRSAAQPKKMRKPREAKMICPSFHFIQLLMHLTEKQRKQVHVCA